MGVADKIDYILVSTTELPESPESGGRQATCCCTCTVPYTRDNDHTITSWVEVRRDGQIR